MKSDRPRIIFVNRVYWPSQEATAQLLTDLAVGLADRGWPVHVIAAGETSSAANGVIIHRTGSGDKNHGLLSRFFNYSRFIRQARYTLAEIIRPHDYVIVMTDPPLLNVLLTSLCKQRGAIVIPWIQDIYPEVLQRLLGSPISLFLRPLQIVRDHAWDQSDHFVTLGTSMADMVRRHISGKSRVTIIPNWAPQELNQIPAPATTASMRNQMRWNKKFVVAYSGNLGRVHEFATLVETAELLRTHLEIQFVIIGRGARLTEVKNTVAQKKLPNVAFFPAVPRTDLPAILTAANAHFVTLSPAFGDLVYPSKLAGVLAAGRPVLLVGPQPSELANLVNNNHCGIAVEPGGQKQLANFILALKNSPTLQHETEKYARLLYEEIFTLNKALDRWEELLSLLRLRQTPLPNCTRPL